jgi:hypothetical protein
VSDGSVLLDVLTASYFRPAGSARVESATGGGTVEGSADS